VLVVKKVYWLSRHAPLPSQIAELRRLFGEDVVVEQDPRPFDSVDDILNRFRSSGSDELLVVAPLSVIAQLVQRGVKPLWAEMEQVGDPALAETEAAGRYYRFIRFRRIAGIEIKFEDV
jgi:hypothetical protein